jgi:hypothetical protein
VAYLRHARTVTSKYVPAITQQLTKRCFLRAEPSSAVPWRVAHRLASFVMTHVTASAVTPRVSTVTQQLKRFPLVRSRVYRRSQWELSVSSRWETTVDGSQLEKSWSCELKTLCVIFEVWFCDNSYVESRCWETTSGESTSASATVICKWCKSAIALYCYM